MRFLELLAAFFRRRPAPPPPVPPVVPSDEMKLLLARHNAERSKSLKFDARLQSAASQHAAWMAANDEMSHTGANGSSVGDRVRTAGYFWHRVGENIATEVTESEAFSRWWSSPGHRNNMLDSAFVDCGLAASTSRSGTRYWCAVYGVGNAH